MLFPEGVRALNLHQINGFDHLPLGARITSGSTGPARTYVERSFFLPGIVGVGAGADKSIIPWMVQEKLAPEEILDIDHECMFQGLRDSEELLSLVRDKVRDGYRPHFFRTTALEAELIQRLGLEWKDTLSCDPAIAEKMGDKAYIRKIKGAEDLFPPHIILPADWKPQDVSAAVMRIEAEARAMGMKNAIVKRTNLASGGGFCDWTRDDHAEFCREHAGHELIVEVLIEPHIPISNQWLILDGKAHYIGTSWQLQDGFVHKGNTIASNDGVVDPHIAEKFRRLVQPLLDHAVALGYNGIIGFDGVYHVATDMIFLTEANGRPTAVTYNFAVASRLDFNPWAVSCVIIQPSPRLETLQDVFGGLGYLLYKRWRENGIAPYMLSGLRLPVSQRRLGLMAIANDPRSAEHFLKEATMRLGA